MPNTTTALAPLRDFVSALTALLEQNADEPRILREGGLLLARLVATDDWLPPEYARPHPQYYQQYLLHLDAAERFSLVSFVWGPGQATPVHNHTVWGLVGMLRGAENAQSFVMQDGVPAPQGEPRRLVPGQVEAVSPTVGDIHRVSNAFDDRVSVSVHVYGGNIGTIRRSVFTDDGQRKPFVSGYANAGLPNFLDR
jgi:predicted metal-dependent enzyme (double-stranded beta helix superfamily)